MIRKARAADGMAVLKLMQEAHAKSSLAEICNVHREWAKTFLARCAMLNDNHQPGGALYLVSETDGEVRGFFIGILSAIYVVMDKLEAQDVHFYLRDDADPRDFVRILDAFDMWAETNPKVICSTLSDSDFISGNEDRLKKVYERRGYQLTNRVYKRYIDRPEAAEDAPMEAVG